MKYIEIKDLINTVCRSYAVIRYCKHCGCIRNRDTAALNILHIDINVNLYLQLVIKVGTTQPCYQVTLCPERFAYPTKQSQQPQ